MCEFNCPARLQLRAPVSTRLSRGFFPPGSQWAAAAFTPAVNGEGDTELLWYDFRLVTEPHDEDVCLSTIVSQVLTFVASMIGLRRRGSAIPHICFPHVQRVIERPELCIRRSIGTPRMQEVILKYTGWDVTMYRRYDCIQIDTPARRLKRAGRRKNCSQLGRNREVVSYPHVTTSTTSHGGSHFLKFSH